MKQTLSLKGRIILQFMVVILPVTLVLIFQTISDLRRSSELVKAFHLMELSDTGESRYKTFLNGVSDAVDSGKISDKNIAALKEVREGVSGINQIDPGDQSRKSLQLVESILELLQKDSSMAALMQLREKIRDADTDLSKLRSFYANGNSLAIKQAERSANTQEYIVLGAIIFIVLVTAMFMRNVGRLTKPLGVAVKIAEDIAKGDLAHVDQTSNSNDEAGKLLRALAEMQNSLRSIITEIRTQASTLSDTATELSESSGQVASSSEHQSRLVTSIAARIESNSSLVDEVAQNALKAQAISAEAEQHSVQGGEIILKAVEDMRGISESVGEASTIIMDLESKSNRISSVINVIKDIADQTNLLALNAAIEAARAGEQGRGFAVVADEVRKLADRTTHSTQEITEMIGIIQAGTKQAVSSMTLTVKRVSEGVSLTQEAGNSIGKIKSGSQQVSHSVNEISVAMQNESATFIEITKNVEDIAKLSQQNNLAIHGTTESALHLKKLSEALQAAVRHFKL